MADLEEGTKSAGKTTVDRRGFLKTAGAAAAVAGGIEGILAARRAPAFAQGTKLHWVRWVDFIPESDVELKRQMPEASKALGAEVTLETINANDLQPRITAAIQSGSGADIFNFQYNWPHLYQNAVVDVSDVAGAAGQGRGRLLRRLAALLPGQRQVALGPALDRGQRGRLPEVVAQGGRRQPVSEDVGRGPQALRRAQEEGQALRPDARPHLRRRPGLHLHHALGLRRRRDRPERQEGRAQQQGHARGGEVHAGVLEGMLRRGRARLGRHQQQPRLPRGRALRHAERRLASTSSPSGRRRRSRTTRASRCGPTSTTRRSRPARPGPTCSSSTSRTRS